MKLVLLAAGHGTRFGGLKQIAPVGPDGEAIMDYTVRYAEEGGYDGVVLVVREQIRDEVMSHVRSRWPSSLPVETVIQPARPGTAYAVLCTRPVLDGPFTVANADDLYEPDALRSIRDHFTNATPSGRSVSPHVLVAYALTHTVLTDAEVKRGLCVLDRSGHLEHVDEHKVRLREDGGFDAVPLAASALRHAHRPSRVLGGHEPVSMNLWGFSPSILDDLERAVAPFEPDGPDHEILLPAVVGALVAERRTEVRVVRTDSRCYGVTHREDVRLVREHIEVACEPSGAVELSDR